MQKLKPKKRLNYSHFSFNGALQKTSNPLSTPRSSKNLFSDFTSLWKDVEKFVDKGLFSAAISTFELCLKYVFKFKFYLFIYNRN